MADAGSRQILNLLNTPSERLSDDIAVFRKGLRRAHKQPYGVPSQGWFDALADMRVIYRDLRAQIDAVDTADPSKQDALDGLDALDRSFGALERGFEHGMSKKAVPKLKKSRRAGNSGVESLRKARKGLAT